MTGLRDSVVFRTIDASEGVVLDTDSRSFFVANPTAVLILESLQRGDQRENIVRALITRFDIDADQAAEDLDAFLGELRSAGLMAEEPE